MVDQACQIRSADVLVRLAGNFVSGRIGDQCARSAAGPPLAAAGLDRMGGTARRDARLRVSVAWLFPAVSRARRCHDDRNTALGFLASWASAFSQSRRLPARPISSPPTFTSTAIRILGR